MRLSVLIIVGLLTLANVAHAQSPQAGWIADAKTGCRVWNSYPDANLTVTWTGACVRGIAQGKGVLRGFEDGKPIGVYEGEYRDGKRTGHGVIVWANGDRYEGDWRDDNANGHGVYVSANGDRYEGDFRDDKRTGHGVIVWANGGRYEGDWKDNQANGVGRLTVSNGTYNGVWTAGCFKDGNRRASIGVDLATCP